MNKKHIEKALQALKHVLVSRFRTDVELRIFGIIVYSKDFWYSDRAVVMPLYKNIQREGLFV